MAIATDTTPITPLSTTSLTGNAPITSDSLTSTPPINYVNPNPIPAFPVSTLNATPPLVTTPSESNANSLSDMIQSLNNGMVGQSAYRASQSAALGVPDLQKTQTDLSARLKSIQNEAQAIPLQLQNEVAGTGATAGGVAPLQTARLRTNAIQALGVSSLLEASRGNLTTALDQVDRAVSQKYDPITEEINAKKANLDLILNSPQYSVDEKNRAQAQKDAQDQIARNVDKQLQNEKDIRSTAVTAANNGADALTLKSIQEAPTSAEALRIATNAGFLVNKIDKAKAVADLNLTNANIANTNAQAAKALAEAKLTSGSLNPSSLIAYANQYASTGAIPADLPKGSFGVVAQFAKEAPKPDGTLVDNTTNIRSSKLSPTQSDGISALYDLTKKLDQAKTDFQQLNTGLIPGITKSIFQTHAQQQYDDLKGEIVDLLARARSGAALTTDEVATYENKLPGKFNKSLFVFGNNGVTSIDDLKSSIEGKLNTTLQSNGVSITGYTPVILGGKQYKVGQIISVNGLSGRVLPDGSIAPIN